jgi:hypothetical protein
MLTTPANSFFDACGDRVPVFWVAFAVNRHELELALKNVIFSDTYYIIK